MVGQYLSPTDRAHNAALSPAVNRHCGFAFQVGTISQLQWKTVNRLHISSNYGLDCKP